MRIILIYIAALVLLIHGAPKYKLCVYPDKYYRCEELSRGNSQVQCIQVQDSVDCALKIQKGVIDFGAFYPEQIHLASHFVNEETAIVGEIRIREEETKNNSFQTVVVIRKGETLNFYKKKYCHPGFDFDELWTLRVRKELENFILKKIDCSDNTSGQSMIERELEQLSNYFEASCRPGSWVPDDDLDKRLKKKYAQLCELCDSQDTCSYNDNRANENALKCLIEKGGNVAYTSLQAANNLADKSNYQLFCKNGQVQEIQFNISNDCSWRNQPWTFIIGQRNKVQDLQQDLKTWIDPSYFAVPQGPSPYNIKDQWTTTLRDILATGETSRFNIFTETMTMISYLERNEQRVNITQNENCNMRWCVTSDDEKKKCEWVAVASANAGIQPELSCVSAKNVFHCLNKIQNQEADVISIDSNYGYLARKKHIHNLLYNEKTPNDVSSILIVLPEASEIKTFSDLKNKKACFPEYRGIAWLSFIESTRKRKLIRNNCDYGKSIAELFSEVCAPGAADAYHYNTTTTDPKKLCSICRDRTSGQENCDANENNKYFNNEGAMKCLIDNTADVVFIEKHTIDAEKIDINKFKVLCEDESIVSLQEASESCALSTTVDSEIISRSDDPRNKEYRLALLQMDAFFGIGIKNVKTMELFKKFDDKEDLMFKSTVIGFDDGGGDNDYVKNYIKLFEHVDQCTDSAASITISLFLMLSSIIVTLHLILII